MRFQVMLPDRGRKNTKGRKREESELPVVALGSALYLLLDSFASRRGAMQAMS